MIALFKFSDHIQDKPPSGRWLVLFCLIYPLLFFPGSLLSRPNVIDETVVFAIVENYLLLPKLLGLVLFAVLGFLDTKKYWKLEAFTILFTLHLILVLLSSLNARDTWTYNLLGPDRRFDGVLYQIFLSVLALNAFYTIKNNFSLIKQIGFCLLLSCCIQTVLLLFQRFGFDPIGYLVYIKPLSIPAGTMTHPGILAAWLLPSLVLAFFLFSCVKRRYLTVYVFGLIFASAGLAFTGNRTSIYILLFFLLIWVILERKIQVLLLFLITGLTIIIAPFTPKTASIESPDVLSTRTLETRIKIWDLALKLMPQIPNFPLLGGGPDAMRLALLRDPPVDKYIKLDLMESGLDNYKIRSSTYVPGQTIRESTFKIDFVYLDNEQNVIQNRAIYLDKAHNLFLDRLISFGIFGALIWMLIYCVPLTFLFRKQQLKLQDTNFSPLIYAVLATIISIVGYYTLWFPVIQAEPLHLIIVSMGWAIVVSQRQGKQKDELSPLA
jgi:O-antigen ligase